MPTNKAARRPIISDLPSNPLDTIVEVVTAIAVLTIILLPAQTWSTLPDIVPTRFDNAGQVSAMGSKMTLLILPILVVVFYAGLSVLQRFPHLYNYAWPITEQNATRQYAISRSLIRWLKLEMIGMFTFLEYAMIETALNHEPGIGIWSTPLFLVIVFGTIGIYLKKSYQAR